MENKSIKSNQLRIGNDVLFGDIESKVIGIKKHPIEDIICIEYIREDTLAFHRPQIAESRLFPIPLSIDRILSFGFELSSDKGDCNFYEKGKHGIEWFDGDEFYFYFRMNYKSEFWFIKELFSIHELQNISFQLTNEELTFN